MTRERAKSMDQRSFWTVDAAGAPGKLRGPPMASPEPGRMLAFAPFRGFIRGMYGVGQTHYLLTSVTYVLPVYT